MSIGSKQILIRLVILLLAFSTAGCGNFVARRIARAPNTYPSWLAPRARVLLSFDYESLTNFPPEFAKVGPPEARLQYRIIEPAEFSFSMTSTNWLERGRREFQFNIRAEVPGRTNAWSAAPRGTVVLLHGYGLAEFAMVPWALRLAQEGWRCVLVDLRGHGDSTGKEIYFGTVESADLRQLLNHLEKRDELVPPLATVGESYGAALALRWKAEDPRVGPVVAIAPYGVLSNAVMNIRDEYAPLLPRALIKAGLRKLPSVIEVAEADLNPAHVLDGHSVTALFVAGGDDRISPVSTVRALFDKGGVGSQFVIVPDATHESVPFHFPELVPVVLDWLVTNGLTVSEGPK